METEKVKEILRDLCRYRESDGNGVAYCFNRVYDSVERCECQCLQDIFYDYEEDGEWIPVSERLPEGKIDPMTKNFELVLCSTVWNVVRLYTFGKPIGHDKAHFWNGGGVMDDYVIAWMPLPEPYKEETDNAEI